MTHWEDVGIELKKFVNEHPKIKYTLEVGAGSHSFDDVIRLLGRKGISMDKDVCNIKHKDETFDMVFGCHCFEHFVNPIGGLAECYRVLKKGGYVWFATPNPVESQTLGGDKDHIFCLFPIQMKKLLKYTGFTKYDSYIQKRGKNEHGWNVITWGKK